MIYKEFNKNTTMKYYFISKYKIKKENIYLSVIFVYMYSLNLYVNFFIFFIMHKATYFCTSLKKGINITQ